MPHDKHGNLLSIGDEVLLRCTIVNVNPGETACNVTAEAVERPEGEYYIPTIAGNSRFYERINAMPVLAPVPEPTDFRSRVLQEKSELDEKLAKLKPFFGTPIFAKLPASEQQRMQLQADLMEQYSGVLGRRIEAFPPTAQPPSSSELRVLESSS